MSVFLPDDGVDRPATQDGTTSIATPESTRADVALMQRVLSAASNTPNLIPPDFMAYILDWIQTQRLNIPIGQVFGYSVAIPPGSIWSFAGSSAPSGWFFCDGSAVSRSSYASLFSVIGTEYGSGDGSTTFNLPDMQGRVPVGVASGGKTEVNALGNNEGLAATLRNVAHLHHLGSAQASGNGGGWVPYLTKVNQYSGAAMSGYADNSDKPAYLVVNFIIKT